MKIQYFNIKSSLNVVVVIAVAHTPFWILDWFIFLNRPIFNLDILLSLTVMIFRKKLGATLVIASWILDLTFTQSYHFNFQSVVDFIYSVKFLKALNPIYLVSFPHLLLIITFLISLFICVQVNKSKSQYAPRVVTLLACGIFLLAADIINGTSAFSARNTVKVSLNLSGSAIYRLLSSYRVYDNIQVIKTVDDNDNIPLEVMNWVSNNQEKSVLFIIVESLGVPKSEKLLEFLKPKINKNTFELEMRKLKSVGSTTSGELRLLCGLSGSYKKLNNENTRECLPSQLTKNNWETYGFHGFSKKMFDRGKWWKHIGLSKTFFAEDLVISDLPFCGSLFRGACDENVIELAINALGSGKVFSYALTLNTHLPVIHIEVPDDLLSICNKDRIPIGPCTHIAALQKIISNTVTKISKLEQAPLVIIIGDHPPPFYKPAEQGVFVIDQTLGYIISPKNN